MYGFAQRLPRSFAITGTDRQSVTLIYGLNLKANGYVSILGEIQLFIASYYRQLSADGKMKNYMINSSMVVPRGHRPGLIKLCYFRFFHFNIHGKLS